MDIVLHSDDLFVLEHWEKSIKGKFIVIDNIEELDLVEDSLIVMSFSICSVNCEGIIKDLLSKNNKLLVLDHEPTIINAKNILRYGASGYGNVIMREHFLKAAINTIKDNMIWLYPNFTTMLIEEMNESKNSKEYKSNLLDSLTSREKDVVKLIAEGLTYKAIAERLNITARTVKAHAQHSYKKLAVKDRLGLALLLK